MWVNREMGGRMTRMDFTINSQEIEKLKASNTCERYSMIGMDIRSKRITISQIPRKDGFRWDCHNVEGIILDNIVDFVGVDKL